MKKLLLLILLILLISLSACKKNDSIYDTGMIFTSGNSTYFSDLKSEMGILGTNYDMKSFRLSDDKKRLFFDINNNLFYIDLNEQVKINKIGEYNGKYVLSKNGNLLTYLLYGSLYQYNFKTNIKRVIASYVADFATTKNGKSFAYAKMVGGSLNLYYKKSAKDSATLLQESIQGFCASSDLRVFLTQGIDGELNYIELGEGKKKLSDNCSYVYMVDSKLCLNNFVFLEGGEPYNKLVAFSNMKITELTDGKSAVSLIDYPYNSKCYYTSDKSLYYFDGQQKHLIQNNFGVLNKIGLFMGEDVSSIAYLSDGKLCITKNSKVYTYNIHNIKSDVRYSSDGKYAYYIDEIDENHDKVVKVRVGSKKASVLADSLKYDNLKIVGDSVFYSSENKLYMGKSFIDEIPNVVFSGLAKYKGNYLYKKNKDLYLIKGKDTIKITDNVHYYIVINDNLIILKQDANNKYEAYYYSKGDVNLIGKNIDHYSCLIEIKEDYTYIKYVKGF